MNSMEPAGQDTAQATTEVRMSVRATTMEQARAARTISLLMNAGALRFGDFTLKDGSRSPLFIDVGAVATGPALRELGELFASAIATAFPQVDTLFGPAYKGFTIATATAIALSQVEISEPTRAARSIGVFFDRKEAKAHGEGGQFIGALPHARSRIVVVDDVTTSGGTKEAAFSHIESAFSVRPIGVMVTVDRRRDPRTSAALNLRALVTLHDIASHLHQVGHAQAAAVETFLRSAP
jgi:orotate phosphoribosyltransferase